MHLCTNANISKHCDCAPLPLSQYNRNSRLHSTSSWSELIAFVTSDHHSPHPFRNIGMKCNAVMLMWHFHIYFYVPVFLLCQIRFCQDGEFYSAYFRLPKSYLIHYIETVTYNVQGLNSASLFRTKGSYCKFHLSVRIYSAALDCQHPVAEMDIV
jgi:hypothetical protein